MNPKISSLLALLCVLPASLPATEALQNVQPLNISGVIPAESGFAFRANSNLTVTALGYQFRPSASASSYVVRLLNAAGGEIRSATLNAPASATNQVVYTNVAPYEVTAGETNLVQAYDAFYATNAGNPRQWSGFVILTNDVNTGTFAVAPEVAYVGAVTNGSDYAGTNSSSFLIVGPNFTFTAGSVVVPSTLVISLVNSNLVQLSWPVTDTTGQLQSALAVTGAWTNVPIAPTNNGPSKVVELPVVPPGAYFRLTYP